MYQGKNILGLIVARGGSKGLKRKNVRKVGGKPLIAWTIVEAKKSKYLDRLILSSEDKEIISVAKKWGCDVPFVRPKELSKDETPGIAPVIHAIRVLPDKYDYVVLLQPTSPLRLALDIDACIELCIDGGNQSCVSVTEPDKSPFWMFYRDVSGLIKPVIRAENILRRQDLPIVYALNGAVYVADCNWLLKRCSFVMKKTCAYIMPRERSLDIDTGLDLIKMEAFLKFQIATKRK
jgi:N-acylneuraminate cytidylyltransferase